MLAVESQNLIDGVKQLLRLARRDLNFGLLCGRRLCGADTLVRLLLTLILFLTLILPLVLILLLQCGGGTQPQQYSRYKRRDKSPAEQLDGIH